MSKPYIPSLALFSGYITKTSEKAAFIIRHFIYNPGGVSDFFEGDQLSLRDLASKYQNTPAALASISKERLSQILRKYIPEMSVDVEVKYENIDDIKYRLIFNVMGIPLNASGPKQPLILNGQIHVDENSRITLKLDP